jgi:hypothetical protein
LIVDYITLRDQFQHLPVHGYYNRARRFQHAQYVIVPDFPGFLVFPGYRHNPPGIDPFDVASSNAGPRAVQFPPAHHFRRFYGGFHGTERRFYIYNNAFTQPGRRTGSHAGYLDTAAFGPFPNNNTYFCRSYIKAGY